MIKALKRSVSGFAATALVFGMFAFAPSTLAASFVMDGSPDNTFNINTESKIIFPVKVTENNLNEDFSVGFRIIGPLGEPDEQNKLTSVFQYTSNNQVHEFEWDGKINGVDVKSGEYKAQFTNVDMNSLEYTFDVVNDGNSNDAGDLDFDPDLANEYEIDGDDYKIPVKLDNSDSDTTVRVYIYEDGENQGNPVFTRMFTQDETYTFEWDGELANGDDAEEGTYKIKVTGEDQQNDQSNTLTDTFKVVEEGGNIDSDGKIAFTATPEDEFVENSDDEFKVSVKLEDENDVIVTASIDGPGNKTLEAKRTMDDNETFVFTWDEDDLDVLGDYELTVQGEDSEDKLTNKLSHDFEVVEEGGSDEEACAGYQDVKEDNVHCDAIEWAKQEGIMTGVGNGDFFAGNDEVDRAQASKISLESFNEYDANQDYCDGVKPLSDVSLGLWYSNYVCRAVDIDMITGYKSGPDAGKFVADRDVSVIEMFAIFLRPLDENMPMGSSYSGLAANQWYSGYAKYAKDKGLYPGTSLSPTKVATRYEIVDFLYELHEKGEI